MISLPLIMVIGEIERIKATNLACKLLRLFSRIETGNCATFQISLCFIYMAWRDKI